jgi:hypothetical protein
VLEVAEKIPSKHSYVTAKEAADVGLRQGLEKYKERLINIHILEGDKAIGSWK